MDEEQARGGALPLGSSLADGAGEDGLSAAILAWNDELAPQGMFTTDTELRLNSWNRWLERNSKLSAQDVLGKRLVDVVPSLVERRLDHCYRDALRGESKVLSRSLHGYLLPMPPTVLSTLFTHMQQSARIAPLVLNGEILGTITVIEDVTEREWQSSVLRQARQRSELLARTLAHLITARDPGQLVREIFTQISVPLGIDSCIHHVLEPYAHRSEIHSASGLACGEEQRCALLELGQTLCGTVLKTRERMVVNHLQKREETGSYSCKGFGYRAFASFPLLIDQRLLGSLGFGSRSRDSFSPEDVEFLHTVSQYAAIALDRARQDQQLRSSEQRFREMASTVPDIIFTAAPDGNHDYLSPRFYELTGLPPDSGLGMGWMQAIDPEDIERVYRNWQHCSQTGEEYSTEHRMRDKDGVPRWVFVRARPIFDEAKKLMRWFGAITDIHELKLTHHELAAAQAQLAEHAASLERTVQERTAELRETIRELESFSYTVAHDLRAPIRTIESYAGIMLEDHGHQLDEQAKQLLNSMSRAARRLDALTKDVLNYTKICTQTAQLMPVDPAEIVHDVMVMNPALQSPSAEIAIVRPLPLVLAHPTLLSQCFSNLLSNAIKFVKPGVIPRVVIRAEKSCGHSLAGRIQVYADYSGLPLGSEVSPASVRPDRIRLWVQDNGIGMEPEVQQKAFGIFERGRGLSGIPGTGVGLAIVAKAMQRMNGDCGVESAPDEGSRFWLELAAA